jgi:hypothetical protein
MADFVDGKDERPQKRSTWRPRTELIIVFSSIGDVPDEACQKLMDLDTMMYCSDDKDQNLIHLVA